MPFNHNDNGIAIVLLSRRSCYSGLPSCASGFRDHAAADMKAQDFDFTLRLVVVLDCIMRGTGIITNFVSTATWLPLHFDQVLVISDKCTSRTLLKGKRLWNFHPSASTAFQSPFFRILLRIWHLLRLRTFCGLAGVFVHNGHHVHKVYGGVGVMLEHQQVRENCLRGI